MNQFVGNLVVELAVPIFALLVLAYLAKPHQPEQTVVGVRVLKWWSSARLVYQVFGPILVAVGLHLSASACMAFVVSTTTGSGLGAALSRAILSGVGSMGWALWNYLVWGGLAVVIQALSWGTVAIDHRVFSTAGFIGAVFVTTLSAAGQEYVVSWLPVATADDLYDLRWPALLRLWTPLTLEAIGAGVLVGYYFEIGRRMRWAMELYNSRYKVGLIMVLLFIVVYPGVRGVGGGHFVVEALEWRNVGFVWWTVVGLIALGVAVGIEIFERVVATRWLVASTA